MDGTSPSHPGICTTPQECEPSGMSCHSVKAGCSVRRELTTRATSTKGFMASKRDLQEPWTMLWNGGRRPTSRRTKYFACLVMSSKRDRLLSLPLSTISCTGTRLCRNRWALSMTAGVSHSTFRTGSSRLLRSELFPQRRSTCSMMAGCEVLLLRRLADTKRLALLGCTIDR